MDHLTLERGTHSKSYINYKLVIIDIFKNMNRIFVIAFIILSSNLFAMKRDSKTDDPAICYFDFNWQPTSKRDASYIRMIYKKSDSLYQVNDYNMNKKLLMKGYYSSISPMIENGYFEFYDSDNYRKTATGFYKNGDMVGEWNFIDDQSSTTRKVNYDLPITSNHQPPSKDQVIYLVVDTDPKFQSTPEVANFSQYLSEHLIYPPMAIRYNVEGKVYIQFVIDENGHKIYIESLTKANKDLIREACRMIEQSPDWIPGEHQGQKVKVKMTIPFNFKFQ